ncbi:MAG: ATPase, T2SS/T4P/T4SS family [Candidatus Pacearchaeota archaeon]
MKSRRFHELPVPVPLWKSSEAIKREKEKEKLIKRLEEIKRREEEQAMKQEKIKIAEIKQPLSKEYEKKLGLPSPISKENITISQKKEEKKVEEREEEQEIKKKLHREISGGRVIASYNLTTNDLLVKVTLLDTDFGKFYEIKLPDISKPTRALLETVKQRLITTIEIGAAEITDINAIERLKSDLKEKAISLLQKFRLPKENINFLTGLLINEMIGLGNIELLVADPNLEEVVITSATEPVRVYHKEFGWMPTNLVLENEKQIENYSAIIARRVGRQITTLTPMLDAHLVTGDRVNAVLYPICTKGNTITIRKFAREPWTLVDFVKNGTCTADVFSLIWLAIQYEMNILFSGGTASGKTTMLNVCTPFFPSNHRIISIEDTRELQLPEHLYWCPLVTRLPNPEGKGEVTMLDLLVNSLRMRPDRIILGEVRKHETAEVLFEAMHTGHSVYATVHADTTSETVARLVNPPISIAPNLLKAVDMNVVMFRDRRRSIRRVYQVAELIPDESDKHGVKPNILYRWEPSSDRIIEHATSMRLIEDLSRNTGMSFSEINRDLATKKQIIEWLVKNNLRDMNSIGKTIQDYYLKHGWKTIKSEKTKVNIKKQYKKRKR